MNFRANNYLLSLREECVDFSLCSKFPWRIGRGSSVMVIQLPQLIKQMVSFLKGIRSVQFSHSVMSDYDPMDCSTPRFPVYHKSLELAQTHVHHISDAFQASHPLSSPPLAFNLPHHQGLLQWVSSLHQVAKVLEFQLQYQSFQWIFRTDFLEDGLVGSPCHPRDSQESPPTPQFKSMNSSCWAFFIVQLSHPYMTTGKTIALTRQTFVGKVMSLLFNMLFRLVITFFPRSKRLLISWLQSPSSVILEHKNIKSATVSPSIAMKWWGRIPWS